MTCSYAAKKFSLACLAIFTSGAVFASENSQSPTTSSKSSTKAAEISRIIRMEVGDRACYIELVDSSDRKHEDLAYFDICEKTNLTGKRVKLYRKKTKVMSTACEGREDCSLSDAVSLIVKVEAAN